MRSLRRAPHLSSRSHVSLAFVSKHAKRSCSRCVRAHDIATVGTSCISGCAGRGGVAPCLSRFHASLDGILRSASILYLGDRAAKSVCVLLSSGKSVTTWLACCGNCLVAHTNIHNCSFCAEMDLPHWCPMCRVPLSAPPAELPFKPLKQLNRCSSAEIRQPSLVGVWVATALKTEPCVKKTA